MPVLPRSFIQIHYHIRPGGVARVMDGYAAAFSRSVPKGAKHANIIVCNTVGTAVSRISHAKLISSPLCDYHRFRSYKAYLKVRGRLICLLERILSESSLPRPVCIVGHNLSLGKNVALSAAFADVARRNISKKELRFFSVIHDLAEEGRVGLVRQISYLDRRGDIWRMLYPSLKNLCYITLNRRNHLLFKRARANVRSLPNPVEVNKTPAELSKRDRRLISTFLQKVAAEDGTVYDRSKRIFLYPARIISRKNIVESVILICVLMDANLLLGDRGTSPGDRKLYKRLMDLCRRYKLPVVFDVERRSSFLPGRFSQNGSIFPSLYDFIDGCVTTSIAEGFGYALYEPWIYRKPVFGRRPLEFIPESGVCLDYLYERFYIPADMVDIERIIGRYVENITLLFKRSYNKITGFGYLREMFLEKFLSNGKIDLALLDTEEQLNVLKKILISGNLSKFKEDFKVLNSHGRSIFPADIKTSGLVEKNRRKIISSLSGRYFDKKFRGCFFKVNNRQVSNMRHGIILKHFASINRLRLLFEPLA